MKAVKLLACLILLGHGQLILSAPPAPPGPPLPPANNFQPPVPQGMPVPGNFNFKAPPNVFAPVVSALPPAVPKMEPAKVVEVYPPGTMEVHFRDGSVVKMLVMDAKLAFETPYGNLLIPSVDIKKIELGVMLEKSQFDVIHTSNSRIAGRLKCDTVHVKIMAFGEQQIKLDNVRYMRSLVHGEDK